MVSGRSGASALGCGLPLLSNRGCSRRMWGRTPSLPAEGVEDELEAAREVDPGQNPLCLDDRPCGLAKASTRAQLPFQDALEGLGLGDPESPDQHLLGLLHEPPGRQRLAQVAPLPPEDLGLAEAFQRDVDGREEPPLVHGREVRDDTRLPGPPDQLGTDIAGEEDDGHRPLGDDRPCRADAVEPGERGLHENEARVEPLGRCDRLLPVPSASEDEMAEPLQLRLQTGSYELPGLDDEDAGPFRASAHSGQHLTRRAISGSRREPGISLNERKSGSTCGSTPNLRICRRVAPVAVIASTGPGSIPSSASEQSLASEVVV